MHKSNISKNLYKIFLGFTKYLPLILAIFFIANIILAYFKISLPFMYYFGGTSFIFIALLYLISWVFQFCHLYRIPLHYVTLSNVIGIADSYKLIPLDNLNITRVYFIIAGVAAIAYIWFMYKNRNKPKIDHIKQLCDNYCDC